MNFIFSFVKCFISKNMPNEKFSSFNFKKTIFERLIIFMANKLQASFGLIFILNSRKLGIVNFK